MSRFDLEKYLKEKNKVNYILTKKDYVTGQTWCILRKQHVCLYFSILFLIGICLELYSLIVNKEVNNSYLISLFSIIFYVLTLQRTRKTAGILYETEPHEFTISYEKKGFTLTDIQTHQSMFYAWEMIKKVKKYKNIGIVYIVGNVYFFLPLHTENTT